MMRKIKKMFFGLLTLLTVSALAVGVVACDDGGKDDDKENNGNGETVVVAGGYGYYPPDQGGIGLELNLYEDGTYYHSQFTSNITFGTYTSQEATGTTEDGNTILYTVTFSEGNTFGDGVHQIVQDSEGAVYLTNMFDDMSNATYSYSKQDDFLTEVVLTEAQFWSNNYEEDAVMVTFYSNDQYALDGINGPGQAGSMGTYTTTEADGVTTYAMTDGDDASKTYTLTVSTDGTITLTVGETNYVMTSTNPDATLSVTFAGTNSWGASVSLLCYSDTTCKVQITLEGTMDFADSTGTWSYVASGDFYMIMLGDASYTGEKNEDGSYSFEYAILNSNFGGEKVVLTYKVEVVEGAQTYTFSYLPAMQQAAGQEIAMSCTATGDEESVVFSGLLWDSMPVTITCAADGTCAAEIDMSSMGYGKIPDGTGTWSYADGAYTIVIGETTYTATVAAA